MSAKFPRGGAGPFSARSLYVNWVLTVTSDIKTKCNYSCIIEKKYYKMKLKNKNDYRKCQEFNSHTIHTHIYTCLGLFDVVF